ncbi:DUF5403 family protein [Streptomyces gilvosporeus]|uniref:HK97 gp10 family phage protein n=1 Tax=Streptomyces gilvosporeus TaxID=553510 RepID=A0A1V0TQ94_9ACTN|nr:DUF5403 family protein [Streptomyces gilvosporeus]ARF55117.1 hypothetical protein B1H19_13715 [Streptomyces gilvosporeus]
MAEVKPNLDSIVAHLPGVREAVADELEHRADRVRAVVEAHRHSGALAAHTRVRTNRTDSTVTLEDPAVFAINYGHMAPNGRWVPGIHAIEAGL